MTDTGATVDTLLEAAEVMGKVRPSMVRAVGRAAEILAGGQARRNPTPVPVERRLTTRAACRRIGGRVDTLAGKG